MFSGISESRGIETAGWMGVVGNCAEKQVQCSNTVLQGKKRMMNHCDNEKVWWTYLVSDEPTMMSEWFGD